MKCNAIVFLIYNERVSYFLQYNNIFKQTPFSFDSPPWFLFQIDGKFSLKFNYILTGQPINRIIHLYWKQNGRWLLNNTKWVNLRTRRQDFLLLVVSSNFLHLVFFITFSFPEVIIIFLVGIYKTKTTRILHSSLKFMLWRN